MNSAPDHQVAFRSSGEDVIEENLFSELGDLLAELFEEGLLLLGRLLPKEIREAEHGVVVQLPARLCLGHNLSSTSCSRGDDIIVSRAIEDIWNMRLLNLLELTGSFSSHEYHDVC